MKLEFFLVPIDETLRGALAHVEKNHHGIIFFIDEAKTVVALATDGDIRRCLLNGGGLDDPAIICANSNFVWAPPDTNRELLLKKLDHHIRVIPLLDESRRLVGIVSRDQLPLEAEGSVYARARAPVRISFGGGGSDVTHYFSDNNVGAVINTTISLYSHATLRLRNDEEVIIQSLDLRELVRSKNLKSFLAEPGSFGLIQALLKTINPDFGFELYLHSDFPMNSGLGGSAVVSATVLGCFNQFRRDRWDLHELAEIAYQAERHHLGIAGGWQDQYATVFGGFNFMEFRMDQNIVHPLRIPQDTLLELEESLILCDTGTTHDSGDIHLDQQEKMHSKSVRELVGENVDLSYEMRNTLLRGRLLDFGRLLDRAWYFKRQVSEKISNTHLDQIYEGAKKSGAVGGKLLGAGGGGFFLFYVPPFKKHELIQHLQSLHLNVRPFNFEPKGLQAWTVRERNNHTESNSL
ncbi:sugar kinase [Polynucleobacter yangtzensis]|jgi:D-glycero-alpha-D-manno-heptose-7-phosphate kinase|uniref:Sugar kinase n=1 Tax=Polynucleobacter yangtzensis TaxID=1743159 RepID=A0A9C7CHQ5_9BURK|nr:CBS domain-containing protein [Polynucleobacter yangtzensis]BDT76544.1 sugar kinase [Polynucleobacter yangtzensis]